MAASKNTKTKKPDKSVEVIREGRILSIQFFKKNVWLLLIFLVAVLSLIGLRYSTQSKMQKIKQLNKELELAEADKIHSKATYMSLIRETEMRELINRHNLGLDFQEQPPYEIIKDKNND